jgi:hypothetical protein
LGVTRGWAYRSVAVRPLSWDLARVPVMEDAETDAAADDDIYRPQPGHMPGLVAQVVGQLGGFALAGPAGAALAPVLSSALDLAIEEVRHNGRRQVEAAIGEAANLSGLDAEDLLEKLVSSPVYMAVLLEAVEAAARTVDPRVVNSLGRCLANAATDGAKVEDETLIAKAFRDLGPAHFRLLGGLLRPSPIFDPPTSVESLAMAMKVHTKGSRASVLDGDPLLADSWDVLLAGLTRHGAVADADRSLEDPRFGLGGEGLAKQRLTPQGWRGGCPEFRGTSVAAR